jgi:hypothetical protein
MTNDARKRVSRGVPTGGQFATENKHRTLLAPMPRESLPNDDDQPSYISENGDKRWVNSEGELDREGGPAIEYSDGTKEWYKNGELHREGGPAVEHPEGSANWYVEGKYRPDLEPGYNPAHGESQRICTENFQDMEASLGARMTNYPKTPDIGFRFDNCTILVSVDDESDGYWIRGTRQDKRGRLIKDRSRRIQGIDNVDEVKAAMYKMALELPKPKPRWED